MKVTDIINWENTSLACGKSSIENLITDGYNSDLLSDVMGNATEGMAWITIQTHKNLVAVASLKDLACIIIANSNKPAQDLLDAAEEEGIPVITTSLPAFEFAGKLYKALKA